jgi:hypothetical protein
VILTFFFMVSLHSGHVRFVPEKGQFFKCHMSTTSNIYKIVKVHWVVISCCAKAKGGHVSNSTLKFFLFNLATG